MKQQASAAVTKEQEWGRYIDDVMRRIGVLEGEKGGPRRIWMARQSKCGAWWQAEYGVWFRERSERNFSAPVPTVERQSVSWAELRRVLHALRHRRGAERLVVILDSEYVYKGITEWPIKWARHGWRVRGREIGHRDSWQDIWELPKAAGSQVQLIWTPSHPNVHGNNEADALAEEGREQHPHNKRRHQREPAWVALGLSPMRLAVPSSSEGSTD